MTSIDDALQTAVRLVLNLLPEQGVTTEHIRAAAEDVHFMLSRRGGEVASLEELVRHVESLTIVFQEPGSSLLDTKGHVEWLSERRAETQWKFWERYRRYMEDQLLMPPKVVRRLDNVTDSILSKLEDPTRPGPWDRRGLVVGHVQSGKTSNYTGLICKAADAGYRLIVVLAGIHNSLRSQTQLRLDEGFLGFDSQFQTRSDEAGENHFIGAGLLPGFERLYAGSLTTSLESGDFKAARAKSLALPVVDVPVLLVVKKHAKIIRYIHSWITGMQGAVDPETGRKIVRDVPLLLIDDEADNASIDTSAEDSDAPSAINREIRRLLHAFDRSAYVGYTATPFANIYADPHEDHDDFGDDIFPRSFIEVLQAPSNYFGPDRVFGLDDAEDMGAVPIHRAIQDETSWMPPGHRKDWQPPAEAFPASLTAAMLDFVLSNAARRARGQSSAHNSMLVHVTRFQDVQERVTEQVNDALLTIRDRLRYGDARSELQIGDELRQRWEEEFVPTTEWFRASGDPLAPLTWDDVRPHVLPAVEKIKVRTMNGYSKDSLDYYENRATGLSVIAVGGDKLSRGLTLEGLSVSYYLRASRMYDTLMQMGRWFGYRPGYEDLCRLYTTPDLRSWYREITLAANELRAELQEMAAQGATPIDYGLRVRTSPAGLSVTAANKMRRAQKVKLSFSGANPETVLFDVRPGVLRNNEEVVASFLDQITAESGTPSREHGNYVWRGVGGDSVAREFFDGYKSDPTAWRVRPDLISQYIKACVRADELTDWTVVLVSNSAAATKQGSPLREVDFANHRVKLVTRSLIPDGEPGQRERELNDEARYAIRRVLSPSDELLDLTEQQRDLALALTKKWYEEDPGKRTSVPSSPSGPAIRLQRRPNQALLLLYPIDNSKYKTAVERPMVGFYVSFPHSERNVMAEYLVNPIWQQLQDAGVTFDEDSE
ncbi:Z1 domain-containing protein [Blastococcus sp. SYSU D00813]